MAIQFGKTWWGEHWLRSLENVDYDNRLPRGASYARNGYVKEIKFKGNQILAKVAGSRPRPYNVTVIVPPFFDEQIDALMEGIISRPALISKLLNRELDPEILTIAENAGLKVFPRQWTDFKMQCSCPDWAVPCKHLAAVIYMISREIDNNPFLVFEIHNVNLIEELNKRGIKIENQKKTEIVSLSRILKVSKKKIPDYDEEKAYERVDFSKLNDIAETIVMLLPDEPPFYASGNFREKFNARFTRNARDAKRLLSKKLHIEAIYPAHKQNPEINYHTTLAFTIDNNNHVEITGENHTITTNEQLIPALFALNPDRLPDYQPSVAAFYKILLASVHLVANGNVVPQIIQLENREYIIRWLPATIDAQVRTLIERLIGILPPNLFLMLKKVGKTEKLLPLENQVQELLSLFISELTHRISKPSAGDLFEDLFFKGSSYAFTGVGEQALSGGVKVWLDRFFLTAGEYRPVVTVTELGEDEFDVQVSVENTAKPEELPIELSKILQQKQYEKQRFKILQSLSLLSSFIKGLDNYINSETREPIQVFNDENTVNRFRKITSPFMMRRMKSDKSIISDLPDKIEQNQFALLTKQQAALYEKTMQVAMDEIEGMEDNDGQSLFKRQGLVLQMILALKQICNHPTNFLKNRNYDASLSGKMELLFELLDSIIEAGEKVLIFTQFREMGDLLQRFIAERFGEQPMFYHGGCTVQERERMVEHFQHNRADKVFLLSLKAAGTGLNLTAASHVIHYDLWWNPAVENQATDRAYRIGQKKNVMVHRFITKNTFEEKINDMIQQKKHLADMTVATGENWIGKLSNKELRDIFS
ncbi:MAG: helicase-related protein [Paludibacteraceae bacterium]